MSEKRERTRTNRMNVRQPRANRMRSMKKYIYKDSDIQHTQETQMRNRKLRPRRRERKNMIQYGFLSSTHEINAMTFNNLPTIIRTIQFNTNDTSHNQSNTI